MKIALQSHENINKVGVFDTRAFTFNEQDKLDDCAIQIKGLYANLGPKYICIFGIENVPYLAFDRMLLQFTSDILINVREIEAIRNIEIVKDKKVLADWCYPKPNVDIPPRLLNFCADEDEDYDLGVFLKILSRDRERLRRIIQRYSNSE